LATVDNPTDRASRQQAASAGRTKISMAEQVSDAIEWTQVLLRVCVKNIKRFIVLR